MVPIVRMTDYGKDEGIRAIRLYGSGLLGKATLVGGNNNNFLFSLSLW